MTLGELIKESRLNNNYTIKEFSDSLGITTSLLNSIEDDKYEPDEKTLKRICYLLGENYDDFYKLTTYYIQDENKKDKLTNDPLLILKKTTIITSCFTLLSPFLFLIFLLFSNFKNDSENIFDLVFNIIFLILIGVIVLASLTFEIIIIVRTKTNDNKKTLSKYEIIYFSSLILSIILFIIFYIFL